MLETRESEQIVQHSSEKHNDSLPLRELITTRSPPVGSCSCREPLSIFATSMLPKGIHISKGKRLFLRLLAGKNAGQFGSADRTGSLQSRLAIFHGNLVRIFHIAFFFAFHTICDVGHVYLASLLKKYVKVMHRAYLWQTACRT